MAWSVTTDNLGGSLIVGGFKGAMDFGAAGSLTAIHPRFLYVVFPLVLVLWCTGIAVVGSATVGRHVRRPDPVRPDP